MQPVRHQEEAIFDAIDSLPATTLRTVLTNTTQGSPNL